ncbi:MAG: putative bifunctional diguanylate cyclase/phosphodiesterase [Pseudorhodoplanes sp.]
MRLAAAISRLVDRVNGSVPDPALHFELVRALYGATSTARPLFIATAAAAAVTAIAAMLSGDLVFAAIASGFVLIGVARSAAASFYHRVEHDPEDISALKRWELVALLGAWAFSAMVGVAGAYAVMFHAGTDVEILVGCCVIGYIAGVSSRNASRPLITIGQVSFTCVPFTLALLLRADVAHLVLAVFIGALYVGTIVICRSVFDNLVSRHQAFRRIETLAQRDALTGLWNRAAFLGLLEAQFSSPAKGELALIAIDLDRFKDINDTLGHPVGDAVLKEAADRIRSALRPGDEVSRVGGDEFLVMLTGARARDMGAVSRGILSKFSDPFAIELTRSVCGASVGCALARHEASMDALLRNADLALYEAKRRGRGQIVEYSAELSREYESRVALEHDLQRALARGELDVVYQPIVDPRSGRAIACEALLRWNHPDLGPIAPDVFIPIAEATGLISSIGAWVLTKACVEATHWSSDVKVSVNLSPIQFRHGREVVDRVAAALAESGLPPSRLDLEITESVFIDDNAATLGILEELRAMKIGISLDDFGTGFASLAYLNDFPFSKIKIDRKFSQKIDESPRTSAIVNGTAQIARELRMECIAEGVETEVQLERLRSFGINAIQGYLFSRPLMARQLRKLIKEPIFPASTKAAARMPEPRSLTRRKVAS